MAILQKDMPLAVLVLVPVWTIGGLAWGTFMSLANDGLLMKWLPAGLFWGAGCWLLTTPLFVFLMREISVSLADMDEEEFEERLEEVLPKLRFIIESRSKRRIVCKPNRLLSWNFARVEILLGRNEITLTGPAVSVKALRKRLTAR